MNYVRLRSKFGGTCRECGLVIHPGEWVRWVKRKGIEHATESGCVEAFERTRGHS